MKITPLKWRFLKDPPIIDCMVCKTQPAIGFVDNIPLGKGSRMNNMPICQYCCQIDLYHIGALLMRKEGE